jgi:hypothetical protein
MKDQKKKKQDVNIVGNMFEKLFTKAEIITISIICIILYSIYYWLCKKLSDWLSKFLKEKASQNNDESKKDN